MLTACGIETIAKFSFNFLTDVATVLTACGIETLNIVVVIFIGFMLQQCLPLAVLKPKRTTEIKVRFLTVATVLTACGIETR